VNRRLQIFDRTGPGVDHPVMSNCPESRYLKVLWARVVQRGVAMDRAWAESGQTPSDS